MEKQISGMMVYYYFVCKRKLWYFADELRMENFSESVLLGKIIDENTYKRNEKHINIDNIINIDYIKDKKILHEVKKSRSIEEAGIWQLKYYLYFLKQRGAIGLSGEIDYPLLRQTVEVILCEEDEKRLDEVLDEISELTAKELPPELKKMKICKACAYYDLCYI